MRPPIQAKSTILIAEKKRGVSDRKRTEGKERDRAPGEVGLDEPGRVGLPYFRSVIGVGGFPDHSLPPVFIGASVL